MDHKTLIAKNTAVPLQNFSNFSIWFAKFSKHLFRKVDRMKVINNKCWHVIVIRNILRTIKNINYLKFTYTILTFDLLDHWSYFSYTHKVKIKINQNCKTHSQIFNIWCKDIRWKCRNFKKNFTDVLFCKVKLSKMASTKTNKIKKQTPLF